MPIEIKELHINVAVTSEGSKKAADLDKAVSGGSGTGDKNAIIAECVEQVLKIIQTKTER